MGVKDRFYIVRASNKAMYGGAGQVLYCEGLGRGNVWG